jgi:hypothetical protein
MPKNNSNSINEALFLLHQKDAEDPSFRSMATSSGGSIGYVIN